MTQILVQDFNANIIGTSRLGLGYDIAHVETLIQTETPLDPAQCWYIPDEVSVPPEVLALLTRQGVTEALPMYPISAEKILAGTEDIKQQAEANNLEEVVSDAAKLMLRAILKKTPLIPLPGVPNLYLVKYDFKVYQVPNAPNNYDFKFVLPFDGLEIKPAQGRIYATVVLPKDAQVNAEFTKGKATDGNEISEMVAEIPNTLRRVVSFEYHIDPLFTIRYFY